MVTARIAGFSPGTSPPPVRIPITPFLVAMLAILHLTLRDFRQVQIGPKPARVPVGSIDALAPIRSVAAATLTVHLARSHGSVRLGGCKKRSNPGKMLRARAR